MGPPVKGILSALLGVGCADLLDRYRKTKRVCVCVCVCVCVLDRYRKTKRVCVCVCVFWTDIGRPNVCVCVCVCVCGTEEDDCQTWIWAPGYSISYLLLTDY